MKKWNKNDAEYVEKCIFCGHLKGKMQSDCREHQAQIGVEV